MPVSLSATRIYSYVSIEAVHTAGTIKSVLVSISAGRFDDRVVLVLVAGSAYGAPLLVVIIDYYISLIEQFLYTCTHKTSSPMWSFACRFGTSQEEKPTCVPCYVYPRRRSSRSLSEKVATLGTRRSGSNNVSGGRLSLLVAYRLCYSSIRAHLNQGLPGRTCGDLVIRVRYGKQVPSK